MKTSGMQWPEGTKRVTSKTWHEDGSCTTESRLLMTRFDQLKAELSVLNPDANIHPEMFSTYGLLKVGDVLLAFEAVEILEDAYADNPGWMGRIERLMEKLK